MNLYALKFYTKSFSSQKSQILDLLTVLWIVFSIIVFSIIDNFSTFLDNCPAKIDINGSTKTAEFWTPSCIKFSKTALPLLRLSVQSRNPVLGIGAYETVDFS